MEQLYTERGVVQKQAAGEVARPWSLVIVTLIAFLLPAGGAVLAVRNMARLGEIDGRRAAELTVVTLAVFGAGYSVLVLAAQPNASQPPNISPAVTGLISVGVAAATFVFQRQAYAAWKRDHPGNVTAPWYTALGWSIVYQVLTLAVGIPVLIILAVVTSTGA